MDSKLKKYLPLTVLLITVSSIADTTSIALGNTFIWWVINLMILIAFLKGKKVYYDHQNDRFIKLIHLYLIWNIFCIVRGVFVAEIYWDWKNLIGAGMVLLLPLSIFISTSKRLVQSILVTWIKYALPGFFLFLPFFSSSDAPGKYLVPISMFLLFLPILSVKWKILLLCFTLVVIFSGLDARSNVIKFSISLLLGLIFYFRNIAARFFRLVRLIFLIAPIVLFIIAVIGDFNVFKMEEYITGEYTASVIQDGELHQSSLTVDTRTALYEEVILSAIKNNYIFFGRTPARGNDSDLFGGDLAAETGSGRLERFGNEVSILNVFTWTGLIGVIIYFCVFYSATALAIKQSNNFFMKIIGLYVSFRWTYAWVEDFSNFDLSYLILWIMIGMCLSKSFREMSDSQMQYWIRGIFDKSFRKGEMRDLSVRSDEPITRSRVKISS